MNSVPSWSLITVSFNSEARLRDFWGDFTPGSNVEWIVIDNASQDNSVSIAKSLGATVIESEINRGFGAANNIGFRAARGKYVAFVNPDVRVNLADLQRLAEHLDASPEAIVSPQLVNKDGSSQPNGRGLPYLVHKIRNRTSPQSLNGGYLRYAAPGERVRVAWLMGAVIAGNRLHLANLGPWDERFFVYYEDSDLGLRNSKIGGTNVLVGDVRWLHGWERETKTASLSAWKREIPSMIKFYARYPGLLLAPREPQIGQAT